MLIIRRVRAARPPRYPRIEEFRKRPELRRLPARWAGCGQAAAAAGMLAALAFSISACKDKEYGRTAGVPLPPDMVTEEDALLVMRDLAGGLFPDLEAPYRVGAGSPAITYVAGNGESAFEEVTLVRNSGETLQLDAFSPDRGAGFEYVGQTPDSPGEPTGYEWTGNVLKKAEGDAAYVLVMPAAYEDGQERNESIREQVESFLGWLGAQGIE